MENKMNLEQWILKFLKGDFDNPSVDVQINAGWFDWFCKDEMLCAKTKKLGRLLLSIIKSNKIDLKKHYTFFKNNCPCEGKLYDDFRICGIETHDVIFTIVPHSGYNKNYGTAEVWGKENEFKEPIVSGKWVDVKNFFLYNIKNRIEKGA